jgi:hypothetical protein
MYLEDHITEDVIRTLDTTVYDTLYLFQCKLKRMMKKYCIKAVLTV